MDAFDCFYEQEIYIHIKVGAILRQEEKFLRPESYNHTTFHTLDTPQNI